MAIKEDMVDNAFRFKMQTSNACHHQHDRHHSRGQFRKFAVKVIEWIRKSLALGANEVQFFIMCFSTSAIPQAQKTHTCTHTHTHKFLLWFLVFAQESLLVSYGPSTQPVNTVRPQNKFEFIITKAPMNLSLFYLILFIFWGFIRFQRGAFHSLNFSHFSFEMYIVICIPLYFLSILLLTLDAHLFENILL